MAETAVDFERSLAELEALVQHLEQGDLALDDMKHAFVEGIGMAPAPGAPRARTAPRHTYVAEPSTSTLTVVANPDMKPGHPKLRAAVALNGLRFGMNFDQFVSATYLQQWVELHQFRPVHPPTVKPRHWWHYAVKCVCGRRSGAGHRHESRWDFGRLVGATGRRRLYVALYKRKLAAEAAAAEDAPGEKVLPPAIAAQLDAIEVKELTYEQAILYRYLAEVRRRVCGCVCGCYCV